MPDPKDPKDLEIAQLKLEIAKLEQQQAELCTGIFDFHERTSLEIQQLEAENTVLYREYRTRDEISNSMYTLLLESITHGLNQHLKLNKGRRAKLSRADAYWAKYRDLYDALGDIGTQRSRLLKIQNLIKKEVSWPVTKPVKNDYPKLNTLLRQLVSHRKVVH